MSKTTIATIKKAIAECNQTLGECMETAFDTDDAIFMLGIIRQAVREIEPVEQAEIEAIGRKI